MKRDPEKDREWRERGAKKYQEKMRKKGAKSLARKKRINPRNHKRAAEQFEKAFLSKEYVLFVHSHECAVPGCRREDIVCAHVGKTRANGGRWYEIAPLCGGEYPGHHQEQEGRTDAFNEKYGIDLRDLAGVVAMNWKIKTKGQP